jgi:signal peptidase I
VSRDPFATRLPATAGWLLLTLAGGIALATRFVAIPWVVAGRSMEPTLRSGDRVLVDVWTYRHRSPRPGEIALCLTPASSRPLVKRVATPPGERSAARSAESGSRIWLQGDNAADSLDSRAFGGIEPGACHGRLIFRYWPPSGTGLSSEPGSEPPGL